VPLKIAPVAWFGFANGEGPPLSIRNIIVGEAGRRQRKARRSTATPNVGWTFGAGRTKTELTGDWVTIELVGSP